MKKTVQIVTIPLDKKGWSKDELLKHIIKDTTQYSQVGDYKLINGGNCLNVKCWQAQQLLVLSDDEVSISDINKIVKYPFGIGKTIEHEGSRGIEVECITCTLENNPYNVIFGTKARFSDIDVEKIIASYPHIEGTLPISKETVQAWIDASTPEEGSVTIDKEFDDWYELMELKSYPNWKPVVDTKGNLLLEFGEKDEDYYDEDIYDAVIDFRKKHPEKVSVVKPSIPTDEEIREKGKEFVEKYQKDMNAATNDKWSMYGSRMDVLASFYQGYKQALKDLGHE